MLQEKIPETAGEQWIVAERPGYLGSKKDAKHKEWDEKYGVGNWQISWQLADGRSLDYEHIFHLYLLSYLQYFIDHEDEAKFITDNYSYAFDESPIAYQDALEPLFLMNKKGISNQFHHVALNLVLVKIKGQVFKGKKRLQVRMGKEDVPEENWPNGWKWHPGRIPATNPHLIPKGVDHKRKWWNDGSIEDLYQSSKVLEVKKNLSCLID